MRLAARELWRRPRSFFVPTGILLLLAVLLLYPSAILDGILEGSTAAVRNAPADLLVFSRDANGVQVRSRVESNDRLRVEATPGVERAVAFAAYPFTARADPSGEAVTLAVLSSEEPLARTVPGPGEAVVDRSLKDRTQIRYGDTLLVGPFRVPVTVVGFTGGADLWLLPGAVVDRSTWREAFGQPPSPPAEDSPAAQTLLVTVADGVDPPEVAAAIDRATAGQTETLTKAAAITAMPGVAEQTATFGFMRAVTLAVALVVVGLFLSFMTLERTPLYAVLKAVGASSHQLFAGVILQALSITAVAVTAAVLLTWALTWIPLELPTALRLDRLLETSLALAVTAVAGSVLSLKRVVRVEPAAAVG